MRLLLIILIVLIAKQSDAQNGDTIILQPKEPGISISLTKRNIQEIIKESIDQPYKGKIIPLSKAWQTCNEDSMFYNKDTIYFCTNNNYYTYVNKKPCCNAITWTFYEQNSFISIDDYEACQAYSKLDSSYTKYNIEAIESNNQFYLKTCNRNKLTNKFKIVNIQLVKNYDGSEFKIVTMIRQF